MTNFQIESRNPQISWTLTLMEEFLPKTHQSGATGLTSLHREEPSTVVRAMSTHAPIGEGPCTEHDQDRWPRPAALPEPRTRHEEAALAPQALAAPAAWGRRTQAGR